MKHYCDMAFREQYPLSSKKIIKKMIQGTWFPTALAVGYYVQSTYISDSVNMGHILLSFIILWIISCCYQAYYIKTYYYNLTDKFLIIRKGIFMPREITVSIERIQDLYIDQDFFDLLLGIYDMHISTATAESTVRAHIDGVSKKVAQELRELVLSKTQELRLKSGL